MSLSIAKQRRDFMHHSSCHSCIPMAFNTKCRFYSICILNSKLSYLLDLCGDMARGEEVVSSMVAILGLVEAKPGAPLVSRIEAALVYENASEEKGGYKDALGVEQEASELAFVSILKNRETSPSSACRQSFVASASSHRLPCINDEL